MSASPLRLFDVFGDFSATWPQGLVQPTYGIPLVTPIPGVADWVRGLNQIVTLTSVRTGAMPADAASRATIEAQAQVDGTGLYPSGFEFAFASMPDVGFKLKNITGSNFIRVFASVTDAGVDVVLEGVPVEITVPPGMLMPPDTADGSVPPDTTVGTFTAGKLDTLSVSYRNYDRSSISVHVRIEITAAGEVLIRSAVPIDFGKCRFLNLPCLAVHGFALFPTTTIPAQDVEWLRHGIAPWIAFGPPGSYGVRSMHLDPLSDPIKSFGTAINDHQTTSPAAEFILDDLVIPFSAVYVVPVPRHITVGFRRALDSWQDAGQVFDFNHAPIRIQMGASPQWGFFFERFWFKSMPATDVLTFLSGVELSVSMFWGDDSSQQAVGIELGENVTPRIVYRRAIGLDGLPTPATGVGGATDSVLHWEIASFTLDFIGFHVGYSLGRALGEHKGFGDSFEFLVDAFISSPPSGADDSPVRLRSLSGQKVAFAIEGVGWKQGHLNFDGVVMPDGVVAYLGPVKIILREIAIIADTGASYLSISAGVGLTLPSGWSGSVEVRRLRLRVSGNPAAPPFKLDGFFISITGPAFALEFGGYFTDTNVDATHHKKEFGLTGTLKLKLSGVDWTFGGDFLVGRISSVATPPSTSAADNFDYLMVEVFFRGSIIISWFELRGAILLFASNMQPKLGAADRSAGELRYYNWYKGSNPLYVSGDRRLAAWNPHHGAWAAGIGIQCSFAQIGKIVEFSVFVMVVSGDDENGLLIAIEVRLMSNPKPVGWGVFEYDGKNGTYSGLIGVDLGLDSFMKTAPDWIKTLVKLTGTLFIGNKPGTVALGRLRDMNTWLSLKFSWSFWLVISVQFGLCFEWTDGVVLGFGFVARIDGKFDFAVGKLTFNVSLGLTVTFFLSGSTDYAVVVWLDGGVHLEVFKFFRFGVSAHVELRCLGRSPSHGTFEATFHLDLPWFLPDVSLTLSSSWGNLMPEGLATSVQALRGGSGSEESTGKSKALHHERFDPSWDGSGTAPNHSILELRAAGATEVDRVTRYDSDMTIEPLATDATIAIELSVPVNDTLALDPSIAPDGGRQSAGDLTLTYDLTGITIRRRSRFSADRSWTTVDQRTALPADFSGPGGVTLNGAFEPQVLTKAWAPVFSSGPSGDKRLAKKLLINAMTPFEFATNDPAGDELLVSSNPNWPCCPNDGKKGWRTHTHEVVFGAEHLGQPLDHTETFTESRSRLDFVAEAFVRSQRLFSSLPATEHVAAVAANVSGVVFRAGLDEDAAHLFVRVAWQGANGYVLALIAYDQTGGAAGSMVQPLATAGETTMHIAGKAPIRRFELRLVAIGGARRAADDRAKGSGGGANDDRTTSVSDFTHGGTTRPMIEIDRAAYIDLSDLLGDLVQSQSCSETTSGGSPFTGNGKLFFLPNHDYEVALTYHISVAHPSKPAESADVTEWVYFKTKGLPGLNAVNRVGEELAPHVDNAYSGGRGVLYREEPVTIAFTEGLQIAVPMSLRPPGASAESATLLEMQLLTKPEVASVAGTVHATTSDDWIVAHRVTPVAHEKAAWKGKGTRSSQHGRNAVTKNPMRKRLAKLTQRPGATCPMPDPRDVTGSVLVAPPEGDSAPENPSIALWPPAKRHTAVVRQKDAPFVEREAFVAADLTAFDLVGDSSATPTWTFDAGALHAPSGGGRTFAAFGEETWNHVVVDVGFALTGHAAGIGVALPAAGAVTQGLFAVVERTGSSLALSIYKRHSAGEWAPLQTAALPATLDASKLALQVSAFDDRLRAQVGTITIESDRGDLREGRLCLVADGEVRFASLDVTGLEMYVFPFQSSKYRSFAEHIGSFAGRVDAIQPNALGAGTSPQTPQALFASASAGSSAITAAMQPDAPVATRQAVFDEWVRGLGLPLKDEVDRLEISRYASGTGSALLLVESPEALDFTREITIALSHQVWVSDPGERIVPGIGGRLARDELMAAIIARELGRPIPPIPPVGPLGPDTGPELLHIDETTAGLRVTFAPGERDMRSEEMVFASTEVNADGSRSVQLYRGRRAPARRGMSTVVDAHRAERIVLRDVGSEGAEGPLARLHELAAGELAVLTPDLGRILGGRQRGHYETRTVPVIALQDATARRVLLIPTSGGTLSPTSSGTWRLDLTLDRARWDTTDPADDLNHYHATATLSLSL